MPTQSTVCAIHSAQNVSTNMQTATNKLRGRDEQQEMQYADEHMKQQKCTRKEMLCNATNERILCQYATVQYTGPRTADGEATYRRMTVCVCSRL